MNLRAIRFITLSQKGVVHVAMSDALKQWKRAWSSSFSLELPSSNEPMWQAKA
jgi:hypothetical protein